MRQVLPIARVAIILHSAGRVLLFLVSLRWKQATRYALFYENLFPVLAALVDQYGLVHGKAITMLLLCFVNYFIFGFWSIRAAILTLVMTLLPCALARPFYFNEPVGDTVMTFMGYFGFGVMQMVVITLIATKLVMIFVSSEVSRSGNQDLLDDLEEGIILVHREQIENVFFQNRAAAKLQNLNRLNRDSGLLEKGSLFRKQNSKIFAQIDKKSLLDDESACDRVTEAICQCASLGLNLSIANIIEQEACEGFPGNKLMIKMQKKAINLNDLSMKEQQQGLNEEEKRHEDSQATLQRFFQDTMFLTVRVKQQLYLGKPAIGLFIRNKTKKVHKKLTRMRQLEQRQRAQHFQTFSKFQTTVDYDMKKPIQTVLQLLQQLIILIGGPAQLSSDSMARCFNLCLIMKGHLLSMDCSTSNLQSLGQLRGGLFQLHRAPFNPTDVIKSICQVFSPIARIKGIDLGSTIIKQEAEKDSDGGGASSSIPYLYGDESRFKQVLINLVDNAVKFTNSAGMITVKASYEREPDSQLKVRVRDSGCGLESARLTRLFHQSDRQADNSNQLDESFDQSAGLGIGLQVVKQIVRTSNGEVTAHSAGLGRGSEVTFTMKMVPAVKQFPNQTALMQASTQPSFSQNAYNSHHVVQHEVPQQRQDQKMSTKKQFLARYKKSCLDFKIKVKQCDSTEYPTKGVLSTFAQEYQRRMCDKGANDYDDLADDSSLGSSFEDDADSSHENLQDEGNIEDACSENLQNDSCLFLEAIPSSARDLPKSFINQDCSMEMTRTIKQDKPENKTHKSLHGEAEVLLANGSAVELAALSQIFDKAGFKSDIAQTTEEALSLLNSRLEGTLAKQKSTPNKFYKVIIINESNTEQQTMHTLSEISKLLRDSNQARPTICYYAWSSRTRSGQSVQMHGVDHYLSKPANAAQLSIVLNKI